ncbi:hypothetical protein Bhyg_02916 [Pseudolycoriella hygida]|uniref:Uncharacterized protein n=1 Tax=Pseudolycoriella hygida TaxID=35572 RepID=A0A9Q0S884_9DIPT|nr:hypothetical protein Bhyg_02916 [Pseudolycoriella hygida]
MDKIFGSWWPWSGRQENQSNYVSTTSSPSTESSTITTTASSAFNTQTSATISNAFYTLINATFDILNNGSTVDPFANDSLLETKDFTEDELLFGMLSTNATDVDLEFERNSTNWTIGTSDIKLETTWQLFSMISTAVILAFVILATVIVI